MAANPEAEDLDLDAIRDSLRRKHLDALFAPLTSFIAFAGYSRSGGSLVAALMDAHPNLVVAHELDVFEHDAEGEVTDRLAFDDRDLILQHVLMQASIYAEDGRKGQRVREDGSRYYSSYEVEGGWQGRYESLVAIGTKNAVESSFVGQRFGATPFRDLAALVELPVRFVHVVRNPFDNIATMKRIHGEKSIVRYFKRADGVLGLKDAGFDVLDVHLDDVIEDPRRELRTICGFYGVRADDGYLDGCAAVVADQHSRTSASASWEPGERRAIGRLAAGYPWLDRYREDPPAGG